MPLTPSFPGVYIEEQTSTSPSIQDAPTSITAFVGRASSGPIDLPGTCFNWADYERLYGGLTESCPLSYAVQQFFQNGGGTAIIARLFEPLSPTDKGCAILSALGSLSLRARGPGTWGNRLQATISTDGITDATSARFASSGLTTADLFNLTLTLPAHGGNPEIIERYLNLSVTGNVGNQSTRIDVVLKVQSALALVATLPATAPPPCTLTVTTPGNNGQFLTSDTYLGGLDLLKTSDPFQLLCIPPDRRLHTAHAHDLPAPVRLRAAQDCADRQAIFLADPPAAWQQKPASITPEDLGISGTTAAGSFVARNTAVYYPNLLAQDPLRANQVCAFAPCGAVAGIIAATDKLRGVWKAPAGEDAILNGVTGLALDLTDADNARLDALGINCLRTFPNLGTAIWSARTLAGADQLQDDFKFLPVRRLVDFLESSISTSLRFAVFETNDETLWSTLRLSIGSFLANLARQGSLCNYSVSCALGTTMTADDVLNGIVRVTVQIAPEAPAEFLLISFQQTVQTPA